MKRGREYRPLSKKPEAMYIKDKEEFRLHWNYFADHWYDESKMNGFNGFAVLYSGPRADICFLQNLKAGSYDRLMTREAKEFFMDNIDNPLMQELYPSFTKTPAESVDKKPKEL